MNLFSRLITHPHPILDRPRTISMLTAVVVVAGSLLPAMQSTAQTLASSAPLASAPAPAASTPASSASISATPASSPVSAVSKPARPKTKSTELSSPFAALEWGALTPAQQLSLKPLAGSWAALSDGQKRKWISLSANFAQLNVDEQTRLHTRMVQWATLSNKQREQARLNFAETKSIAPAKKTEQWQAYQALSAEEKQKLAKSAPPKPPRTALAAQPAATGKLSQVSVNTHPSNMITAASGAQMPNNKTLLVRPVRPKPPVSAASDVPNKP